MQKRSASNLQVENQINMESKPACTSLGCMTGTAAPHKPAPEDKYPKDYFVPNFGPDRDVVETQKHYNDYEKKISHTWDPIGNANKAKAAVHPIDYGVPNFGMDRDIGVSLKNMATQESIHGAWNVVQTNTDINLNEEASNLRSNMVTNWGTK